MAPAVEREESEQRGRGRERCIEHPFEGLLVTTEKIDPAKACNESLIAPRTAAPSASEVPLLAAGERAVICLGPISGKKLRPVPVAEMLPAEIERALAWQERRLEFVAAPLAEILAEFNRHNRAKLSVVDPVLAGRRSLAGRSDRILIREIPGDLHQCGAFPIRPNFESQTGPFPGACSVPFCDSTSPVRGTVAWP
jgi:hypothetical protein